MKSTLFAAVVAAFLAVGSTFATEPVTFGTNAIVKADDPPPFYCSNGTVGTTATKGCTRLPPMPLNVRNVRNAVTVPDLVKGARTTLVVGDQAALCYTGTNWQGARESSCKVIPDAKPLAGYDIVPVVTGGTLAYVFKRKPGTQASRTEMADIRTFMASLYRTADSLRKIGGKRLMGPATPGTPRRAPAPGAQPSAIIVPTCSFDDEGGEFCSVSDGGDGDDGGDAGGGTSQPEPTGNGSTMTCLPPTPANPVPVCVVTALRPTTPAPGPIGGVGGSVFDPSNGGPITSAPPADSEPSHESLKDKWDKAVARCTAEAQRNTDRCYKLGFDGGWPDDRTVACLSYVRDKEAACLAIADAQYGGWKNAH